VKSLHSNDDVRSLKANTHCELDNTMDYIHTLLLAVYNKRTLQFPHVFVHSSLLEGDA
jgi:hypothetical protein